MLRVTLALAAAALVLTTTASASAEERVEVGPHFRVHCHFDDTATAAAALETVEAVWPAASRLYGLRDEPLDPPLDVHLYRRSADYLAKERELAGGRFDRNLAFSSFETQASYVAIQPDVSDEAFDVIGLGAQTRHNLAHEAAHLVSYRATAAYRRLPSWISEGSAIWIEQESMIANGWSLGREDDPYVSNDMVLAQRLLAGGRLPHVGEILRDEIGDLGHYERYAVQGLLFRRLVTRKDCGAFRTALLAALGVEACPDFGRRFLEAAFAPYEEEGLESLDLDFEQFVRSQRPAWEEPVRSLSTVGDAWTQAAFAEADALAWRTATVAASAYELRGELELLPSPAKSAVMSVLVGRDRAEGFVSIDFAAGRGVNVYRFAAKDRTWELVESQPSKVFKARRRLAFRVAVDGSRLTVRLDGAEIVSVDAGRALTGAWGLGVEAGCAGLWRNVRVEPSKPK